MKEGNFNEVSILLTTIVSKGYRSKARGYVIYSPRALPKGAARGQRTRGNKSHNHGMGADKRLIFTLARIPQGIQKYIDEKCLYCSSFFCFLILHAGTGGIPAQVSRLFNYVSFLKSHFE